MNASGGRPGDGHRLAWNEPSLERFVQVVGRDRHGVVAVGRLGQEVDLVGDDLGLGASGAVVGLPLAVAEAPAHGNLAALADVGPRRPRPGP